MKTATCLLALLALLASTLGRADAAPTPLESDLFPLEFFFSQHEALGLNETQLQDMQATVQDAQPKFEALKGQLDDRVKALQDTLRQDKPDLAQAEAKLRAMLAQENDMKSMQIHLLLTLRNKLTPDQLTKARALRAQATSASASPLPSTSNSSPTTSDPSNGLRERMQAKFEQLKTAVQAQAQASGGQPPEDVIAKAHEIQQLMQSGKAPEAEKALDALLATMPGAKAKP